MKPIRIRTLAGAAAAAAVLLVPSVALGSDGTIKSAAGAALTQLTAMQAGLAKLQPVLTPGTPAAKLKAYAKPAIQEGTIIAATARKATAALKPQKPSSKAGAAAKATCLKLFAGTATLGDAAVAWGKATAAGKTNAALVKKLQTGAMSLLQNGIACQTAVGGLK